MKFEISLKMKDTQGGCKINGVAEPGPAAGRQGLFREKKHNGLGLFFHNKKGDQDFRNAIFSKRVLGTQ